jgi:hypothetical protein
MPSSGKLRRVGLLRTNVSEEGITSIFKVETIRFQGTVLAVGG